MRMSPIPFYPVQSCLSLLIGAAIGNIGTAGIDPVL